MGPGECGRVIGPFSSNGCVLNSKKNITGYATWTGGQGFREPATEGRQMGTLWATSAATRVFQSLRVSSSSIV